MSDPHDGYTCEEFDATHRLLLKRVPTLDVGWEYRRDGDAEKAPPKPVDEVSRLQLKVLALETTLRADMANHIATAVRCSQLGYELATLRKLNADLSLENEKLLQLALDANVELVSKSVKNDSCNTKHKRR